MASRAVAKRSTRRAPVRRRVRRNPSTPGLVGGGFLGALAGALIYMVTEPEVKPAGYDSQKMMAMYALGGAAVGAAGGYGLLK